MEAQTFYRGAPSTQLYFCTFYYFCHAAITLLSVSLSLRLEIKRENKRRACLTGVF
jgi:hypothetical protein